MDGNVNVKLFLSTQRVFRVHQNTNAESPCIDLAVLMGVKDSFGA